MVFFSTPPGRVFLSCQVVDVNLKAFLAPSLTVPVAPHPTITNSVHKEDGETGLVLVKRMELGLQAALAGPGVAATAQVQYSGGPGNVIFVIKSRQVYGSLAQVSPPPAGSALTARSQDGLAYSLEPCVDRQEPCHLWVEAPRKHGV